MNIKITFEGQPPFGLKVAQRAKAYAVGNGVEMVLYISAPEISRELVAIQVPMLNSTAQSLGDQLRKAGLEAELHALKNHS